MVGEVGRWWWVQSLGREGKGSKREKEWKRGLRRVKVQSRRYPGHKMYMYYRHPNQLTKALVSSGAKVNWVNEEDDSKTPLHQSILGVS